MKIFGKRRKKTSTNDCIPENSKDTAAPTQEGDKVVILEQNDDMRTTQQTDSVIGGEEARSYFSPDFFPSKTSDKSSKKKNHDIQELLAMDPKNLTSKQRRLIRRHEERTRDEAPQKQIENSCVETEIEGSTHCNVSDKNNKYDENKKKESENPKKAYADNIKEQQQMQPAVKDDCDTILTSRSDIISDSVSKEEEGISPNTENALQSKSIPSVKQEVTSLNSISGKEGAPSSDEVLDQLKNLNSKERRKLLRKLASESKMANSTASGIKECKNSNDTDGNDHTDLKPAAKLIVLAAEESNRIAEKNRMMEKEKAESHKKGKEKKRKAGEIDEVVKDDEEEKMNNSKPKKKKIKDLSHLPAEERARREEQRRMQKEAAERRKADEVLTRHPLNSERRRANRRKPGRAGKIAILKKETKEKLDGARTYNAGGYMIRQHMKNNR